MSKALIIRNLKLLIIGNGGFAYINSANFQGKTYALKCFYNNLHLDSKALNTFICEVAHVFY
ncbi:hypothetical protein C2G38_2096917 [Gigaspora rosea]|uniref:Protein kinase domain-containing protein n=1 Tax=Gigaspora rosea TaxID=44941 RepID=A0A397UXF3_9GLOM|nr:hypothetical protein C2G38_2096917 [Gigaspora rosea]